MAESCFEKKKPNDLVGAVLYKPTKAKKKLISLTLPLLLCSGVAEAQLPIFVTVSHAVHFGSFTGGAVGGTVKINTAGSRSVTGSVSTIASGGLEAAGVFVVNGSTGLVMDVSVSSPALVNNGGGASMAVNNFNLVTNSGGAVNTISLTTTSASFPIGATLVVGAGQAEGTYTGSYTINIAYQ